MIGWRCGRVTRNSEMICVYYADKYDSTITVTLGAILILIFLLAYWALLLKRWLILRTLSLLFLVFGLENEIFELSQNRFIALRSDQIRVCQKEVKRFHFLLFQFLQVDVFKVIFHFENILPRVFSCVSFDLFPFGPVIIESLVIFIQTVNKKCQEELCLFLLLDADWPHGIDKNGEGDLY